MLPVALTLVLGGCGSLGPTTVRYDMMSYNSVTAQATKEQTLLNVVRLGYGDQPAVFKIGQVVSGYTFAGQLAGAVSDYWNSPISNDALLGADLRYEDRPSITYNPVTGRAFGEFLLRPFVPGDLIRMIAAGHDTDLVLGLAVQSIEGLPNAPGAAIGDVGATRAFAEFVHALGSAQVLGILGIKHEKSDDTPETILTFHTGEGLAQSQAVQSLQRSLRVAGPLREQRIVYGTGAGGADELVVQTRSLLEIMMEIGSRIAVPEHDVAAGMARPTIADPPLAAPVAAVRVQVSTTKPETSYARVHYLGRWYWIADDDYASKRAFTFLLLLASLAETDGAPQAPVLTIPTG